MRCDNDHISYISSAEKNIISIKSFNTERNKKYQYFKGISEK